MLRSLTHPDTQPDSSEKHNSRAKFKNEINIHKLSKGGLEGYKIRWWQNGKRKEVSRKRTEVHKSIPKSVEPVYKALIAHSVWL